MFQLILNLQMFEKLIIDAWVKSVKDQIIFNFNDIR